jgi:galactokinase
LAAMPSVRVAGEGWLAPGKETTIAGAPGRLDVMGGIADYSGATVLEATIGDLAVVALQRRTDSALRVRTAGDQVTRLAQRELSMDLSDFYVSDGAGSTRLASYDDARALFSAETRWAAYVLGVFYVLLAENVVPRFDGGADLVLHSSVPLGAGVASSAAIEVATMRAVLAAYGIELEGMRLASLCQIVENRVVGAPCGIMDQVTCTLGREGALLALQCQPHEVLGYHAPPPGYAFLGLDSGVKHAVGGVRYPRVRCAAFMGQLIIQDALERGETGIKAGLAGRAHHLANLTPAEFRTSFEDLLPTRMQGAAFIERWGDTRDSATTVQPDEVYLVRGATEHPIYENARVERFIGHLGDATDASAKSENEAAERAMRASGRLMFGSHRSYSRNCGLGSRETDLLVSLVRAAGPENGLYGAKITGGGSGGTVAVLYAAGSDGAPSGRAAKALEQVKGAFERTVGRPPRTIAGSLPGAVGIEPAQVVW